MNAVEIEEALSELVEQPLDAAEFPFQFLTAFGAKDTTIKRLRNGDSNASDVAGGVLQRNNIHIAVAPASEVSETLAALRCSPKTGSLKAKFLLATDGDTVEAEALLSGDAVSCAFADLPRYFGFFLPLAGISTVKEIKNNPIDVKATGRMKSESDQRAQPLQSSFRINRRIHHRYVMVLRDGFLHTGSERVECVVRNISSDGLMARVYRPIELGDCVRIELAGGHLLEGTVLWIRDWEVGVAFSDPVDVETLLAQPWVTEGDGDRRRTRRVEAECPVTLKVGMRFYYGRLCDLSPKGARVRTQGALKTLGNAVLTLPDLPPLPASIRWVSGRECGLAFAEPVPVAALGRWLQERGFSGLDDPGG